MMKTKECQHCHSMFRLVETYQAGYPSVSRGVYCERCYTLRVWSWRLLVGAYVTLLVLLVLSKLGVGNV